MKEDKKKPTPLHERIHGENEEKINKDNVDDVDEVIKGGSAGNPYYKNMNNIKKSDDSKNKQ